MHGYKIVNQNAVHYLTCIVVGISWYGWLHTFIEIISEIGVTLAMVCNRIANSLIIGSQLQTATIGMASFYS